MYLLHVSLYILNPPPNSFHNYVNQQLVGVGNWANVQLNQTMQRKEWERVENKSKGCGIKAPAA